MPLTTDRSVSIPGRLALPVILTAQLVIPMSIAGTAVALPRIAGDLGANPGPLQWIVNGFNVAFALATLLWGALADRLGHDRTFRAGIALALLGSLASAAAGSLLLLDVARIVTGLGAAAVLTGATAIISNAWEGPARAKAFALFGTINGLGLAVGPSVSGALVQALDWRGVFGFQAVALAVALVASGSVPRVRIRSERRRLLDLGLLTRPGFTAMALVPVAGAVGFVTLLTYLPAAFSAVHGWSPGQAGAMMLVATLPVVLAPTVVATAQRRYGWSSGAVVDTSMAALILGTLGLQAFSPDRSVGFTVAPMVLIGLGFGLPLGLVDAEALAHAPAESSGSAAGLLNFLRIGFEAVAVAAYSAVLTILLRSQAADPALADAVAAGGAGDPTAYAGAFHVVLVGLAIVVAVLAVAARRLRAAANR